YFQIIIATTLENKHDVYFRSNCATDGVICSDRQRQQVESAKSTEVFSLCHDKPPWRLNGEFCAAFALSNSGKTRFRN
ncbi:MAG TPA: hypothetical protein VHT34_02200, partial [Clostridia bacterium]|nr:hypothetical protein [Clostridia bacterium]